MGIREMFSSQPSLLERGSQIPSRLPVAVPQLAEEEEEPLRKVAALLNKTAQRAGINWWQVPAHAALGAGGVAGGWALMDKLLDSRRKAELDQELSDAQSEYEEALRQQYETALTKRGVLDEVFEKLAMLCKAGGNSPSEWLRGLLEAVGGAYVTGLGVTGGAGALGGYHWAKSQSRRRKLEEAMRLRRAQMANRPEPLYAYPVGLSRLPETAQKEEERALA
jgi:hypothetical protein